MFIKMKALKYIPLLIAAGIISGCEEKTQLGEQNKGKERPVVEISAVGVETSAESYGTSVDCVFTLSVSDGSQEYGYVVLQGADPVIPGAYSILAGEVSENIASGVYFYEEGDAPRQCSFSSVILSGEDPQDYTICAAAITSTGLTSDVAVYVIAAEDISIPQPEPEPDPVPDFTVRRGGYYVVYETYDSGDKEIETDAPGTEFIMGLSPFEGIRPAGQEEDELYVFAGSWFNMAGIFGLPSGSAVPPQLVGKLDRERYTITFDQMLDPSSVGSDRTEWRIQDDSPYQTAINNGSGSLYMFRGGGDGEEPVVMTLDEDGKPMTLSAFGFAHVDQDAEDPIIAYYDRADGAALAVYQ